MKKTWKFFSLVAIAAATSACGGGGGSSGAVSAEYQITLRADKLQLPTNIGNVQVGQGVYSPYTTTLYVNATVNGQPIPGGDKIFGCNVEGGLASGSLYYLDGNPEHEVEVDDGNGGKIKVPAAYRSITLGSNAGGASFHFHAGDEAGTSRITCSVTDPRDKQQKSASVAITVGGATGKPASVRTATAVPGYLGTKGNGNGVLNQMAVQAFVMDDANQPTPSTSGNNVQVRILGGTAATGGARLVAGAQSGSVLQLPSVGGVATFSLLGGEEAGTLFLEMTADRFDNNVSNGIQDPISAIRAVQVLEALTGLPVVQSQDLGEVTKGTTFTALLSATGGLPPYVWSATGLPNGLSIDAGSGMISGVVAQDAAERDYNVTVTVTDKNKLSSSGTIKLKVVGGVPEDLAIGTCNPNQVCDIGVAPVGVNFTYSFVASVKDATWTFNELPSWLSGSVSGSAGVLNGKPKVANCGAHTFTVTAKKGSSSVTRLMRVRVVTGAVPAGGAAEDYTCP